MRRLIVGMIALSLALLTSTPSRAMTPAADPPPDCFHQSANSPHSVLHHDASPDPNGKSPFSEQGPFPCCAGLCFAFGTLAPMPESIGAEHETWHSGDSSGIAWNIEPADPPPRR